MSSFYRWYRRYNEDGYDGLASHPHHARCFWNMISDCEKQRVIDVALAKPELTPRELAWEVTDSHGAFISESSVYRIRHDCNLVTSPNYFQRVHESLNNLTPADVYHGKAKEITAARNLVKEQTMHRRRRINTGLQPINEEIIRPTIFRECVC